jgi:hypothetical protein
MRALRLLGKVAAGLAVACVLLLGGALTLLRTRWGGERLRVFLIQRVGDAIAGRLSIGSLRIAGDTFVLRDLVLSAPSGAVVARIERVALELDPWALLHRQAHVRALDLRRPAVLLAPSARGAGLSLARALSPRGHAGGSSWSVAVDRLSVTDGKVSIMSVALERSPAPVVTMTDIRAAGSLAAQPRAGRFAFALSLTGEGGGGLHGRLALEASAHRRGGEREAGLTLSLDDTARVRGGARGGAWWVSIDELIIAPELVRALWPAYPVRPAIAVTGDAHGEHGRVVAHAWARTPDGGELRFAGDVELGRLTTRNGVRVTARGLDLATLLGGKLGADAQLPLAIDVDLRPGPLRPEGITGSLRARVPRDRVRGSTFGPLLLRADAVDGHVTATLSGRLRGARLAATVGGTTDEARGKATLAVPDLGGLRRSLGALGLDGLPAVDGRGRVEVHARGAPRAGPGSVELDVRARVSRLELSGDSGGRWRNLAISGRLGQREAGNRRFALNARARAPLRGSLAVSGDLRAAERSAQLRDVRLRYPGARWRSTEPAVVRWGAVTQLSHLRLEDRGQRLALDLRVWPEGGHEHLDGDLVVRALRLGSVPLVLGDVTGRFRARVRVDGTARRPILSVQARATDLSLAGVGVPPGGPAPALIELAASYEARRARFSLVVPAATASPGAGSLTVRGTAKVDLGYPQLGALRASGAWKRVPLSATLRARHLRTRWLAGLAPELARVKGRVSGRVRLHGSLGKPVMQGALRWEHGVIVVKPRRATPP